MNEEEGIDRDDDKAEALRIIAALRSQYGDENNRVMTYYVLGMREHAYPHMTIKFLEEHTGGKDSSVYRRLDAIKNGFDYDYKHKKTVLNPDESDELYALVVLRNSQENSMTYEEITAEANRITEGRRAQLNRPPISVNTIRQWAKRKGLLHSKPMSPYEMKALSCRVTIAKMYENLHREMETYKYPPYLVLNMDETWVSTEGKMVNACVVYPKGGYPIRRQATLSSHITLIGCISLDGEALKATYLVPHELQQEGMVAKYHLRKLKYFVQKSGFMTVDLYVRWLKEVLVPYVEENRNFPGQMALLIVDPHSTRTHEKVNKVLFDNNIRQLILPASVTSKFQPLDRSVYSIYKSNMRKNANEGPGGVYAFLHNSLSAFQIATAVSHVEASWKNSDLFNPDYKDIIESFPEGEPSPTDGVRSNIVMGPTYETSTWEPRNHAFNVYCNKDLIQIAPTRKVIGDP